MVESNVIHNIHVTHLFSFLAKGRITVGQTHDLLAHHTPMSLNHDNPK